MYIIIILIILILIGSLDCRENISSRSYPRKIFKVGDYIFDDTQSSRLDLSQYWKWKLDSPNCKSYHQCYR